MSAKYLLPCHDGKTVEVSTADAGRMVVCPCGEKVQVPTLRGVQRLARVAAPEARTSKPAWSARQGAMFTSGLSLLVIGLVAAGMLYNHWRKIDTARPDMNAKLLVDVQQAVDNAEPADTLNAWQMLRDSPLPEDRGTQPWEANRAAAQQYLIFLGIAGTVAAIGLGLAVAGPLLRPAVVQRAPKRAPAARR